MYLSSGPVVMLCIYHHVRVNQPYILHRVDKRVFLITSCEIVSFNVKVLQKLTCIEPPLITLINRPYCTVRRSQGLINLYIYALM